MLAQDTDFEQPDRTARDTYEQTLGARRAEQVPLSSLGLMHEAAIVVASHDRRLRRCWEGRAVRLERGAGSRQKAALSLVGRPRREL